MTIFSRGCVQDAHGDMLAHMHPDGEVFEGIGGQEAGEPCVWCARGVPRHAAIKRVVENGLVTLTDAETGAPIMAPYRLDD